MLRAFVAALVHRGRDPSTIRSLHDVATVAAIKDGLRFYLARAGGKKTAQIYEIYCTLTAVARHWVKLGGEDLNILLV